MEIDTIALLTLSSIVVAGSTYVIWAINCRRRRTVEVAETPQPPKDWGVHNPALNASV
jgi:hypothetical protein